MEISYEEVLQLKTALAEVLRASGLVGPKVQLDDLRLLHGAAELAERLREHGGVQSRPSHPQSQFVGRFGDMAPRGESILRVGFDAEQDVVVTVHSSKGSSSIEFCTEGSGGGKSPRTRDALVALMVAMEADNAASPALQFPPD